MLQASILDGVSLSAGALGEDLMSATEVDIGRREIVDALVVAAMVIVLDEGFDLGLEVTKQVGVFQQNAFFRVWCQRSILPWVWGW